MKKLLTLLGAIAVTASTASLVVACGNNDDDDTGSIFIDNGGDLKIDSEALLNWYTETHGYGTPIKAVKSFYQLFAVAVLNEATKSDSTFFNNTTANKYSLENMQKQLADLMGSKTTSDTSTVYGAANNSFEDMSNDLDDDHDDIVDKLKAEFPNVDENYDALKKAYINNFILTDSTDGAYAKLTNLFTGTYNKANSSSNTSNVVSGLMNTFKNNFGTTKLSAIKAAVETAITGKDSNDATFANILNLINMSGGMDVTLSTSGPISWDSSKIVWATNETTSAEVIAILDNVLTRILPLYGNGSDQNKTVADAIGTNGNGNPVLKNYYNYIKKDGTVATTFFDLVSNAPTLDSSSWMNDDDQIYGFLSNSQRYVMDKYFETQQPVALEEVVFKKGTGDTSANINGAAFFDGTTTKVDQYEGLVNFLNNYVYNSDGKISGTSLTKFDTIFSYDNDGDAGNIYTTVKNNVPQTWDSSFYTLSNDSTLLTLSDSTHSNIAKYSIYDFLQSGSTDTYALTGSAADASSLAAAGLTPDEAAKVLKTAQDSSAGETEALTSLQQSINLITSLDRKVTAAGTEQWSTSDSQTSNKVYQVLNADQGIIAFVDTDGLHIARVKGYETLKTGTIEEQKQTVFGTDTASKTSYINEANAFTRLNELASSGKTDGAYRYVYGDNNFGGSSSSTTPTATAALDDDVFISQQTQDSIKTVGVTYDQLNTAISNPYEKYLVNTSVGANSTDSANSTFTKYNIITSAKDYATGSDSSTTEMADGGTWLIDYISEVTGATDTKSLLSSLFQVGDADNASDYMTWITNTLDQYSGNGNAKANSDFKYGWTKWLKTIDDTKVDSEYGGKNRDLPLAKLAYGTVDSANNEITDYTHMINVVNMTNFNPYASTSGPAIFATVANVQYAYSINIDSFIAQSKRNGGNK